ncbi:CubicO group peptidase (beta-lactamase class C family) [Kibdelosporangium banguiense]|uniref:CubicO group peptidase (Beta-lactamase class C family) n=1 Tax=Kibdelosporangium banguiense TaxID=1365924 RepID=A0ABS4TJI7_9PSEU|nr:serine hydrolase domain-containing protein [Kibdelosporangium banguiense]MBP2324570.1 CubicO group peptidase (beta-lactamase class C family) [Kibdelosporangium banguiense]
MSQAVSWDDKGNWTMTDPAGRGLSAKGLRRMHDVLARHVESGIAPGLVALVSRGDETHVEAMGTLHAGGSTPMRRDTIFRMASLTKPVTAAAAMILVEECRLRLDDPVETWLPELADRQVLTRIDASLQDTVPARRSITVRDLLTLTFGFGLVLAPPDTYPIQVAIRELGIVGDGTSGWPTTGPDEWIKQLGTLPLMYQPGERWQYHVGSDVLGVLVARVAEQSFGSFLAERLFGPLGMADTGFHVPADKIHRLPTSYAHDPMTGELSVWDSADGGKYSRPPVFEAGGDGLVSTVDDYHAFYRMLLNNGTHGGERVLSRASVELMTMDHLTAGQKVEKDQFGDHFGRHGGFGFGMAVRTHRRDLASVGQFGWDGGLGTTAYADPARQFAGILLTQTAMDSMDTPRLHRDFWTTAYQTIG